MTTAKKCPRCGGSLTADLWCYCTGRRFTDGERLAPGADYGDAAYVADPADDGQADQLDFPACSGTGSLVTACSGCAGTGKVGLQDALSGDSSGRTLDGKVAQRMLEVRFNRPGCLRGARPPAEVMTRPPDEALMLSELL